MKIQPLEAPASKYRNTDSAVSLSGTERMRFDLLLSAGIFQTRFPKSTCSQVACRASFKRLCPQAIARCTHTLAWGPQKPSPYVWCYRDHALDSLDHAHEFRAQLLPDTSQPKRLHHAARSPTPNSPKPNSPLKPLDLIAIFLDQSGIADWLRTLPDSPKYRIVKAPL
jgi:hypothetical protein